MVLALVLTGCFAGPGPHEYDLVDAAAKQLRISQVGTVLYEGHYGTMRRVSGPGPSVEFFVATDDAGATRTIIDTAVKNGWEASGDLGASTTVQGHSLQLAIRAWPAGSPTQTGDGKSHTWDRAGVLINIDQS
ncbi:hypothetical protein [Leifsonia sp. 2MCAF36]|uniref:hypothetical protein n=1 Tax=Leifsonia sp. 2MCAF36 TaxID=3232988 RepID=UPI003F97A37E